MAIIGREPWLWGLVGALLDDAGGGRVVEVIRLPRDTAGEHGYVRAEARVGLGF